MLSAAGGGGEQTGGRHASVQTSMLHTRTWAHGQTYSGFRMDQTARREARVGRDAPRRAAQRARRRRLSSPRRTAHGPRGTTPGRFSGQERATCARRGGSCATHVGRRSLARTAYRALASPVSRLAQQSQCRRLASGNRNQLLPRLATCDRYQSSSVRLAVLFYNTTRSSRGCLPQRPLMLRKLFLCVLPPSCRNRGAIHANTQNNKGRKLVLRIDREDRGATSWSTQAAGGRQRTRGSWVPVRPGRRG
jgi:hypothetical protein